MSAKQSNNVSEASVVLRCLLGFLTLTLVTGVIIAVVRDTKPTPVVVEKVAVSDEAQIAIALARGNWTLDCMAEQKENSVWRDNPAHINKCVVDAAKIFYIEGK